MGQVIEISGDSMNPTVKNGEKVVAEKISTKFGDMKRGEIIVFTSPEKEDRLLIKRVIGLPNETIEIRFGLVYINGQRIEESYLQQDAFTTNGAGIPSNKEIKLGKDEYVVMGDNRGNSVDSRAYGPINKESVLGRALFVYSPIKNFRLLLNLR
jgi:signal peptidase I